MPKNIDDFEIDLGVFEDGEDWGKSFLNLEIEGADDDERAAVIGACAAALARCDPRIGIGRNDRPVVRMPDGSWQPIAGPRWIWAPRMVALGSSEWSTLIERREPITCVTAQREARRIRWRIEEIEGELARLRARLPEAEAEAADEAEDTARRVAEWRARLAEADRLRVAAVA